MVKKILKKNIITTTKPAFLFVKEALLSLINDGIIAPGEYLPAEREISKAFDVSRGTVKRAIVQLNSEGRIDCRHGCRPKIPKDIEATSSLTLTQNQKTVVFLTAVPFTSAFDDRQSSLTSVVHHVMRNLSSHGLDLLYVNIDRSVNVLSKILMLKSMSFGGVIYFHGGGYVNNDIIDYLKGIEFPSVVIEGYIAGDHSFTSVNLDNFHGGYVAAQFLIDRGHTSLCHVLVEDDLSWVLDRYAGFESCARKNGIDTAQIEIIKLPRLPSPKDMKNISSMVKLIAKQWPENSSAIFASTDSCAQIAVNAGKLLGKTMPKDISIIGFNNTPFVEKMGLTTMSHMTKEIGELAAKRLMALIKNPNSDYVYQDVIKPKLIIRKSVHSI